MNRSIEVSLFLLIGSAIIVLLLEGLGPKISFKDTKEKPHIRLFCIASILMLGSFLLMELYNSTKLHKVPDQYINHIAAIFLMINTLGAIFIGQKTLKNFQTGQMYFLLLCALILAIANIASPDLLVKFITSISWLIVMTTLVLKSADTALKTEIGIKMMVNIMVLALLFLMGLIFIKTAYKNIELTKISANIAGSKLLGVPGLLLILASFLVLGGIPPFHFSHIDAAHGGNVAISFLLLGNGAIQCGTNLSGVVKLLSKFQTSYEKSATLVIITLLCGYLLLLLRASDQSKIKRTFIYMAASLAPIFALTLSFGSSILTPKLIYLLILYIFLSLSLFILFYSLSYLSPLDQHTPTWEDIAGLGKSLRVSSLCLMISLASLSGMPGTLGFFVKLSLIAKIQKSIWLNLAIFLSILIGTGCTMRIFVFLFSKEPRVPHEVEHLSTIPFILICGSSLLIFFGFFPFIR